MITVVPLALIAVVAFGLTIGSVWGESELGAAEQAVRGALERYWEARNTGDIDRFMKYYADDALIDSNTWGKVPKTQYEAVMRKWLEASTNRELKFRYRITKMTFPSQTRAIVGTHAEARRATTFTDSGFSRMQDVEWVLEERAGTWLIVETRIKR